ncbi:MAG: thrombospondin type 3 repeat-containing protein [Lysobacterales bacterium]
MSQPINNLRRWTIAFSVVVLAAACANRPAPGVSVNADGVPFYQEIGVAGKPRYLAGVDLFPQCGLGVELKHAHPIAECVLGEWVGSEPEVSVPQLTTTIVPDKKSSDDGLRHVTIQRYFNEVPVLNSRIRLTLDSRGRVMQLAGQLVDPAQLPSPEAVTQFTTEKEARSAAEKLLRLSLLTTERYYDVQQRSIVSRLMDAEQENVGFVFNERQARVVGRLNLEMDDHPLESRRVRFFDYTGRTDTPNANSTKEGFAAFERDIDDNVCRYRFDHGASHRDGHPILGYFAFGKFAYGSKILELAAPCGAGEAFFPDTLPGNTLFDAINVYFWINDLARFAKSSYDSIYRWADYSPKPLRVQVDHTNTCTNNVPGCANPKSKEYLLRLAVDLGGARDLSTMAHEFGHIIQFMYGHKSPGPLHEGLADANVARYSLFRAGQSSSQRSFDDLSSLEYMDLRFGNSIPFGHNSYVKHGAELPSFRPLGQTECGPDQIIHVCGQTVGVVYWELAWNHCRTGYTSGNLQTCESGQRIVDQQDDRALQLVNRAYSYAMKELPKGASLRQFFNSVSFHYFVLLHAGEVSPSDHQRVLSVLNHHCVGWGHRCGTLRQLPGHTLAAARIHKLKLTESCAEDGPCQELQLLQDVEISSDVSQVLNVLTPPGGNTGEIRYLQFNEATDWVVINVEVPVVGYYQVSVSARGSSCCGSIWLDSRKGTPPSGQILSDFALREILADELGVVTTPVDEWNAADVIELNSDNTDEEGWAWHTGPTLYMAEGTHRLRLRHRKTADVEAIAVKKVSDQDNDGIADTLDNCPTVANVLQADVDADGLGNVCDIDPDNDGIPKCPSCALCPPCSEDNCPLTVNPDQKDTDYDGIGNACDRDADGDGIIDVDLPMVDRPVF